MAATHTTYVKSKDGSAQIAVVLSDELHRLCWGKLHTSNRPHEGLPMVDADPAMRPDQVALCHQIGQSVMLDNGAFSKWKSGKEVDWDGYYDWCDRWLDYPTTWAVIPDEIEAGSQEQDYLIRQWPHGERGAPVWHMDEPIDRALRLADEWPRICFGANGEYATIPSPAFEARMDDVWNELAKRHKRTPWVHMLRGMQLTTWRWPFASADSTDVAQNHNRPQNTALAMADRWDAAQCPPTWTPREPHPDLFIERSAA